MQEFEPEHVRLFHLLAPHLQRAVQLSVRLARLEMKSGTSIEALNQLRQGVLLVDRSGGVAFANREAERLFAAAALHVVEARYDRQSFGREPPTSCEAIRQQVSENDGGGA